MNAKKLIESVVSGKSARTAIKEGRGNTYVFPDRTNAQHFIDDAKKEDPNPEDFEARLTSGPIRKDTLGWFVSISADLHYSDLDKIAKKFRGWRDMYG